MALDQIPKEERTPNPSQVPVEAGLGIVSSFFFFFFFFLWVITYFLKMLFKIDITSLFYSLLSLS